MGNYWMVPRNKRKLHPVVDILSLFNLYTGVTWSDINQQIDFEEALERFGLKIPGPRRDRRAGGARTYEAWLSNLGLLFKETTTGFIRTTLAGESLLAGEQPVPIITNQLMKMQYPSPYSLRGNVNISNRFNIRPFRFLLQLLSDDRIGHLTQKEIAYCVVTLGANESDACFEDVVFAICEYRNHGTSSLPVDFNTLYSGRNGVSPLEFTYRKLEDVANTFINYLQYTQLIIRVRENGQPEYITIATDAITHVDSILNDGSTLKSINTSSQYGLESFQRNFGLAPGQTRDGRNFSSQQTSITAYRDRRVRSEVLHILSTSPIVEITTSLINEVVNLTGYTVPEVEAALQGFHPELISQFEANYLDMAVSGTRRATEFELATKEIFEILGFDGQHVGMHGLHPDVFVESPANFSGILDTKAIRQYSLSNDHRNRMMHNYIPTYREQHSNLEFFMYIADSFGVNYVSGMQNITRATNLNGSGITAYNLLRLLNRHLNHPISHRDLRVLLKSNTVISITDIDAL